MARKRVEDTVPALESWDDVNQALATIADNQRTVENFEAAMQNKIDEAKAEAEARSRVFIEATKRLERQIKEFAEAHRDDMDGKKTKTLNFGAVGFRKSTKIKLPNVRGAALLAMLLSIVGTIQLFNEPQVMSISDPSISKSYTPMMMALNTSQGTLTPGGDGPASAVAIVMALIAGVLAVVYTLVERKVNAE